MTFHNKHGQHSHNEGVAHKEQLQGPFAISHRDYEYWNILTIQYYYNMLSTMMSS